jgi:hypothetical protein
LSVVLSPAFQPDRLRQEVEKAVVVEAVRAQVPVMLEHLRSAGSYTARLAQIVHVGKHELELLMDKTAAGVRVEGPTRLVHKPRSYAGLVWIILITILITFVVV